MNLRLCVDLDESESDDKVAAWIGRPANPGMWKEAYLTAREVKRIFKRGWNSKPLKLKNN